MYELTPTGDSVVEGCSLNLTDLNQDPDQRLEEPKAGCDSFQEGKPRCMNPIIFALFISNYSIFVVIIFICAFTSLGVG